MGAEGAAADAAERVFIEWVVGEWVRDHREDGGDRGGEAA